MQFLVPYNELVEEAVKHGRHVAFDDLEVKILSLEYLMAVMVQTDRSKDRARLEDIESMRIAYNRRTFAALLRKHGLQAKWRKIKHGFAR